MLVFQSVVLTQNISKLIFLFNCAQNERYLNSSLIPTHTYTHTHKKKITAERYKIGEFVWKSEKQQQQLS